MRLGVLIGWALLALVAMAAIFAPLLASSDPWAMVGRPLLPPLSEGHVLGTDSLGRDVLAGIIHGARVSLLVGLGATAATALIGIALGMMAGYAGGWTDTVLTWITEFFQVVPSVVLAVVVLSFTGPSLGTIVLVIALISWPPIARLARAETMTLKSREYVAAARLQGESHLSILAGHILPNAAPPLIALLSLVVATAILTESALAFLGLGDPNRMSWGYMIGAGRTMLRNAWWITTFPGLALLLTVLAINMVSEAFSDRIALRGTARGTR